jgi:hypothetical protein
VASPKARMRRVRRDPRQRVVPAPAAARSSKGPGRTLRHAGWTLQGVVRPSCDSRNVVTWNRTKASRSSTRRLTAEVIHRTGLFSSTRRAKSSDRRVLDSKIRARNSADGVRNSMRRARNSGKRSPELGVSSPGLERWSPELDASSRELGQQSLELDAPGLGLGRWNTER